MSATPEEPPRETAASAVPRARLEREYAEAFLPRGLVPILLPLGHEVGDVVAALGGGFVSRRAECFNDLVPREAASNLANVELTWGAAARISLGAEGVAEAVASGQAEDLVTVRFEGARAQSASLRELRRTLSPDAPAELAALLRGDPAPAGAAGSDWLLIGEVLAARTVVRVRRSRGGRASLSFLQGLAARLGLNARAEGGGEISRAETAELSTTEPLPVAFRPAVIRVTPELAHRYRAPTAGGPVFQEFRADDEAHRAALAAWVERALGTPDRSKS